MNHESAQTLTRRRLLGQAAGAAALAATAQAQPAGGNSAPRIRDSFDFGWKFFKGDAPGAQQPDFPDTPWRSVDLPHDWSIEGPFSEKEPAQASLPAGIGWYRKRFRLPESYRDRTVLIEFGGIYENSEVWINGQYLGKRPYGYIPFSYDLTPHLDFGRDNVVAVKVDNSHQTNCRWYSGSGIYRHTWLLATNQVHVAYWGTFATTPHVSKRPPRSRSRPGSATTARAPPDARWLPAYSTRTAKRSSPRRRCRRWRPMASTSSCSR